MRAGLAVLAVAACGDPVRVAPPPAARPTEGISVAIYAAGEVGFGVVDDRRRVTIERGTITLDRIDPDAPLPSLVIEPLDAGVSIGACVRLRAPGPDSLQRLAHRKPGAKHDTEAEALLVKSALSPLIQCSAAGTGSHLVRVLYVAPGFRYRVNHEIQMTEPERAVVTTQFSVPTPVWKQRAQVTLFDGLPGGEEPPVQIAAGAIALDGAPGQLALPPRTAHARVLTVYDGGVRDVSTPILDPGWNRESRRTVWSVLELDDFEMLAGAARVHLELPGDATRDLVISASDREQLGKRTLRLPLYAVQTLAGNRRHTFEQLGERGFAQRFELSVISLDDSPHEVWIEERLRPVRGRKLTRSWPVRHAIEHGRVRVKVTVPPRKTERLGFTIEYPR